MSAAIIKYKDIMRRYHAGEFGDNPVSLHQILSFAGVPNLLNEMDFNELSELILETEDISFRAAIAQIRDMKD